MLTPAQISQATATTNPGSASPSQAMTPEQAHAWISGSTPPSTTAIPSTPVNGQPGSATGLPGSHALAAPAMPVVSNPMTDINKAGADVASKIQGTGDNAGQGAIERGVSAASSAAMAIPNVVADVIPGGKAVLNAVGEEFNKATSAAGNIGNVMADISQKLGLMSPEQRAQYDKQAADFANSTAGQTTTHIADTLNSLGNIANVILMAKGGAETAQNTANAVPGAIDTVKQGATAVKNTVFDLTQSARQSSIDAAKADLQTKVAGVADQWKQPIVPGKTSNPASFNKAREILVQTPDTPQFLAEQKLSPYSMIEGGKYATADTASALRDTAGKMSTDTLRPSLQVADYSTPKTPITDIIKQAISNLKKDTGITPGDLETITRNINKEAGALSRKFPDGMSLTEMHDNKITYANNGGWKGTSVSDSNIATMNRNIGIALMDMVEKNAPKDIPVSDFNDYLKKYYKAADYLDALNTKKAPVSLLQNVAHRAAQVTGAVVGHGVGGGVLGGVGGYMIGGALEHALENMTIPMKDSFLRNLQITQPEAFIKVKEFLKDPNAGMLALPPATSDTPIPLGAGETPKTNIAPHAVKTLPTSNPKTGRMQTTYSSSLPK